MARRPFRRTLILASVALGTALAAAGGWKYARASAPLSGPIIIISIDTLRRDHLPAYGYKKLKTPAIDELAANGVVFERAYSHAPQTLPAHTALLTGRLPFETGVRAPRASRAAARSKRPRATMWEGASIRANVCCRSSCASADTRQRPSSRR